MILKDPMLWRIIWKEYRVQRGFWLSIAGFSTAVMLLLMWLLDGFGGRLTVPWVIALGMPALYALGSAAMLFAAEREEGTGDLLRILAARSSCVFFGKVGFTIVSTVAILGVLLALAQILTGEYLQRMSWGGREDTWSFVARAAWVTLELLAWGVFFSAVCRRVLTAVCFAAFVPLLVKSFVQEVVLYRGFGRIDTVHADLLLLIPVLAASFVVVRRTLAGRSREWSLPRLGWRSRTGASALDRLAKARDTAPGWRRAFTRLVWLELRQALSIGHVLWIFGIFLLALAPWLFGWEPNQASLGSILIAPALIGVWTFQSEQGRRTRFLAEHGLSPRVVWLSRQLVWLVAAFGVTVPCLVVVEIANAHQIEKFQHSFTSMFHHDAPWASAVEFALALACLGFGAGQLASMLIPRGVTAGFVGFVIFWVLGLWAWLMMELAVPYTLSVAPLVILLLAATLIWSRHWLLEQTNWRSWTRLALGTVVSLIALWGAVGVYRICGVPLPEVLWQPDMVYRALASRDAVGRPNTPEEIETARLYEQAMAQFRAMISVEGDSTAKAARAEWEFAVESPLKAKTARAGWEFASEYERRLLAENQNALQAFLATTRQATCAFSEPLRKRSDGQESFAVVGGTALVNLVLLSARELESQGKLDEALERYLAILRFSRHVASRGGLRQWVIGTQLEKMCVEWLPLWAAHPDQTPERLDAAVQRIALELKQFPSMRDALAVEQFGVRRQVAGDWGEELPASLDLFGRWFPWEKARALRVLDLIAVGQYQILVSLDQTLAVPEGDLLLVALQTRQSAMRRGPTKGQLPETGAADLPWRLAATTPALKFYELPDPYLLWESQLLREMTRRDIIKGLRTPVKRAHAD